MKKTPPNGTWGGPTKVPFHIYGIQSLNVSPRSRGDYKPYLGFATQVSNYHIEI
jgi:hypothetical protein